MSKWILTGTGFSKEQIVTDGNRFLCANGYMGLRGVFEEADASLFPAITLAGVYDQYQDRWREPVNAPHCLFAQVCFNGKALSASDVLADQHRTAIDYGDGVYSRETDFGPILLRSERFVSMAETHLLCDRLTLQIQEDGELTLCAGISADIWDINGPHLFDVHMQQGEALLVQAFTGKRGSPWPPPKACTRTSVPGKTSIRTKQASSACCAAGLQRAKRCKWPSSARCTPPWTGPIRRARPRRSAAP